MSDDDDEEDGSYSSDGEYDYEMEASDEGEGSEEEQVQKVDVVRVKRNKQSIQEVCVICTENFNKNSQHAAFLECNHWFHFPCISKWLEVKNKCPHCMLQVTELYVNNG